MEEAPQSGLKDPSYFTEFSTQLWRRVPDARQNSAGRQTEFGRATAPELKKKRRYLERYLKYKALDAAATP